jgi:hypothetical protein
VNTTDTLNTTTHPAPVRRVDSYLNMFTANAAVTLILNAGPQQDAADTR